MRGTVVRIGLGILLLLSLIVGRVLHSSWEEAREGAAAEGRGEIAEAVHRYGQSARLYAPGNPWSRRALDRHAALATDAEGRGDGETALAAWREVRSSILATRSLYTPHPAALATANEQIARLAARLESPSVDPTRDEGARRRWHRERLATTEEPHRGWALLALVGLALWLGAAVAFLRRGLDGALRLVPRPALLCTVAFLIGFALFALGLARA